MSPSYRSPERLTANTYLDRYKPHSWKQERHSCSGNSSFNIYDKDRFSRSSYDGQHEKVGGWAGRGRQQAVYRPRSNSRYHNRSVAEPERYCDRREQQEQSADQFSRFTQHQQRYVSPPQRACNYAAEHLPQKLNNWTAISQDRGPGSQPKRGFFDPNVAPFVPQKYQRTKTKSVWHSEKTFSICVDQKLSYDKREGLPPNQISPGMTKSTAISTSQSEDILYSTLDSTVATTTKQAALLAKNHALAELLSPSFGAAVPGIVQSKGPPQTKGIPQLYLIPKPSPSITYLERANEVPTTLDSSRRLLVILDLNGTLLARVNRSATFVRRPRVHEFLEYLFFHHRVMVWSSARPENVQAMCAQLFTPQQQRQLVGVWARDMLRLGPHYNTKVQVYKTLAWVWDAPAIQATATRPSLAWAQHNTVLIDDSLEKAASEPFNLIEVDEFERRAEQMQSDVLGQVVLYLETLRWQENVSAFLRTSPFRFDAAREGVQWSTIT
nr:putative fcp1 likey domain-containing protein [Quercus suber]